MASVRRRRLDQELNIIVAGRHVEITDALRERATEKVGKLGRHFEQMHKAQVWLRVEPYPDRNQIAEVTLWADGVVLRGEEASDDLYASIDLVTAKLEKQISKFRSKIIDRRRTLSSRRKLRPAAAPPADDVEEKSAGDAVRIERRKRFELKPMMPEDAALQMELLGHAFYVFRNAETLQINVVYRRSGGGYGLIEPEV
jgi:putative sigma-54 modulation protein